MAVSALCVDSWARRDVHVAGRRFDVASVEPSVCSVLPYADTAKGGTSDRSSESAAILWSAVTSCTQDGHWFTCALAGTQGLGCSSVVPPAKDEAIIFVGDTSSDDFLRKVEVELRQTWPLTTVQAVNTACQLQSERASISPPETTRKSLEDLTSSRPVPGTGDASAEPDESLGSDIVTNHSVPADGRRRSAGILRKRRVEVGNSRPRSKSEPSRRRSVHFSDTKGLPLVQAKEPDDWPCLEDSRTSPQTLRQRLQSVVNEAPVGAGLFHMKSLKCKGVWRLEGEQPANCADFELRLTRQQVCLERAQVNSSGRLHGMVRVVNLAYSKNVFVRLSEDGWRSFIDIPTAYCGSQGAAFDRFAFSQTLGLSAGEDTAGRRNLCEFAVCYRVLDMERWDNNNARNYVIACDR